MGSETAVTNRETPIEDPYFYGWRYVEKANPDGSTRSERVPLTEWDVLHPQEEDFIVHNDIHDDLTAYLKHAFRWRLADRPDALVLHDHRVDWQVPGIAPLGPDVVVFFGSEPWERSRGTYPVKDQGAKTVLVVEVTSPSTRVADLGAKVDAYHANGVPRYVIVDIQKTRGRPTIRLLDYRPSPEGYTLSIENPNRLWIPELKFWIAIQGDEIVCLDENEKVIADYVRMAQLASEAEARAATAARETNVERQRAEQEKARAEQEKSRAEQEKARAESAEARMAELEAELQRLRGH